MAPGDGHCSPGHPPQVRPWPGQALPSRALDRGLSYVGSGDALQRFSKALVNGEPQAVVLLGGSVAFGRGAPVPSASFANLFAAWINSSFPAPDRGRRHSFHNSAIPGSTSGIFAACTDTLVPAVR